jgi:hypothetical protein
MIKATKFLFALLFTGILLTGCGKDDNKDGGKPLSGRPTTMGQEGNTFEVTLGEGVEGVKDISVEVTKFEKGVSTITGSVELTNPLLAELADAIFDRFPGYGTKSGNQFSADVDIKFTDIGVAFVDKNKKEYTNVEYNAKVGDTYTTTINGKTYARTVIGKSNMTVMRTGGERLSEEIELTEVESKDHDFPNLDKVIYYFNDYYGLVKATAFFLDGTEKTMEFVSLYPNDPIEEDDEEIFNNNNVLAVQSDPTNPTEFTIDRERFITEITTYHYFNGGTPAGTISLKHTDGTIYGPWQSLGIDGQGGVENAYWSCYPDASIKAGTYTIQVSNNSTWSHNNTSDNRGFAVVKARK